MSIRSNIEDVMEQIANGNTSLGNDVRLKSVAAIKAGEGSGAWQDYMELFSSSPTQLARLMPTDNTADDSGFDLARAYLVGNGTCGVDTTGFHLISGVGDKLDENL